MYLTLVCKCVNQCVLVVIFTKEDMSVIIIK